MVFRKFLCRFFLLWCMAWFGSYALLHGAASEGDQKFTFTRAQLERFIAPYGSSSFQEEKASQITDQSVTRKEKNDLKIRVLLISGIVIFCCVITIGFGSIGWLDLKNCPYLWDQNNSTCLYDAFNSTRCSHETYPCLCTNTTEIYGGLFNRSHRTVPICNQPDFNQIGSHSFCVPPWPNFIDQDCVDSIEETMKLLYIVAGSILGASFLPCVYIFVLRPLLLPFARLFNNCFYQSHEDNDLNEVEMPTYRSATVEEFMKALLERTDLSSFLKIVKLDGSEENYEVTVKSEELIDRIKSLNLFKSVDPIAIIVE